MSLMAQQEAFMAALSDTEERDCPSLARSGSEGFAIYRNAYRTVLVDALRATFPRTVGYVGESSFRAAAAHHLITVPPTSWSLDHAGKHFDRTLRDLFAHNSEVAELAALEWAMHSVFVARDVEPLHAGGFARATADFDERDWSDLRLDLVPHEAVPCEVDLLAWWKTPDHAPRELADPKTAFVWRERERPVFVLVDLLEARALALVEAGASFEALCEMLMDAMPDDEAAALAGTFLANWLGRGWVAGTSAAAGSRSLCDPAD